MGKLKAVFSIDKGLGIFVPNSEIDKLKKGETLTCKVYNKIFERFDSCLNLKICEKEKIDWWDIAPIKEYKKEKNEIFIDLNPRMFSKYLRIFSNDFKNYKDPIIYFEDYEYFKLMYDSLPQ